MKKLNILLLVLTSLSALSSCGGVQLDKVTNINYEDGILTYDAVENAEGYNVKFTHRNEVVYEDKIQDTALDVESLGIEGNINLEISAYAGESNGEVSSYDFTVLSIFKDVTFEAEDNLYNFGIGKEQSNFRNNPAASKGAYVGGMDDCGHGIYINYLCPFAGSYILECYYTAVDVPSYNDVWINGEYQTRYVFTENTGYGGDTFTPAKAEVTIDLEKGWNTISVYRNGTEEENWGSFTELDYFVLKGNKEKYNVDDLLSYGERPEFYRLEGEMGSPRKLNEITEVRECKNPAIAQDANFKYSNGFLLGDIEAQWDGVTWHFNSPVKAKYELTVAYASGEFEATETEEASRQARPSFVVSQEEIGLSRNADFKKLPIVTMDALPYTGWNNVTVAEQKVEITLEQGKNFINCLLLDDVNNVRSGFFQIDYVDMKFISEL